MPLVVIADRTTSSLVDTIEVDASSSSGYAADFVLSSYNGLLNGTYTCQDGNGTTAPYVYLGVIGPSGSGMAAPSGCMVNITFTTNSAGVEHAQGTFSGTTTGTGGIDTITEGTFDVTVVQMGSGAGGAGGGGQGGTGSGAGGNGGMGGAAGTEALCTSSCTAYAACGVTIKSSCVADCQTASTTYQSCIAAAGSDCNALALCYFQAAARSECTTGGVPSGTATCAATDTCEGTCNTSGGGAACRCGCLAAAAPSLANFVLGVNSCASDLCTSSCTGMSSPECNTCYQQTCSTPRTACLAH